MIHFRIHSHNVIPWSQQKSHWKEPSSPRGGRRASRLWQLGEDLRLSVAISSPKSAEFRLKLFVTVMHCRRLLQSTAAISPSWGNNQLYLILSALLFKYIFIKLNLNYSNYCFESLFLGLLGLSEQCLNVILNEFRDTLAKVNLSIVCNWFDCKSLKILWC